MRPLGAGAGRLGRRDVERVAADRAAPPISQYTVAPRAGRGSSGSSTIIAAPSLGTKPVRCEVERARDRGRVAGRGRERARVRQRGHQRRRQGGVGGARRARRRPRRGGSRWKPSATPIAPAAHAPTPAVTGPGDAEVDRDVGRAHVGRHAAARRAARCGPGASRAGEQLAVALDDAAGARVHRDAGALRLQLARARRPPARAPTAADGELREAAHPARDALLHEARWGRNRGSRRRPSPRGPAAPATPGDGCRSGPRRGPARSDRCRPRGGR